MKTRLESSGVYLIANWQLWVACKDGGLIQDGDALYTPHPGLYEALTKTHDVRVHDVSSLVSDDEYAALGHTLFSVSLAWRDALNLLRFPGCPPLAWGDILARTPHQRLVGHVYHALELQRLAEREGLVAVPYFPSDVRMRQAPSPSGMNYYGILAASGTPPRGVKGIVMESPQREDVEYLPGARPLGRVHMGSAHLWVLRMSSRRNNLVGRFLHKVVARVGVRGLGLGRDYEICLLKPNELLTARIPGLLARGYLLRQLTMPPDASEDPDPGTIEEVETVLTGIATKSELSGFLQQAAQGAAHWTAAYLAGVVLPTLSRLASKRETERLGKAKAQKILLSNGLYSPLENLFAAFLHECLGYAIVCCQHGGSGLMRHDRTMLHFADMVRSDGYVCFNGFEKQHYRSHVKRSKPDFFVSGAWKEVSAPAPSIARRIVRRHWKIPPDRTLVLYAPTRFKDGHIWLPDGIRDMPYWRIMKAVGTEGMGHFEGIGVVKVHQKGIVPKGMRRLYKLRKSPLDSIELPQNVMVKTYPDLTYSRHASDIIIVDCATSTIGWAFSCDAIMIYLNLPFNPLEDEVVQSMREAVFFIDTAREDWTARLRSVLEMDPAERAGIWSDKRDGRERFVRDCVLGPKRDGGGFSVFLKKAGGKSRG